MTAALYSCSTSLVATFPAQSDERTLPLAIGRKCLIQCGLSPQHESTSPSPNWGLFLPQTEKAALSPFGKLGPPSAFIHREDFPTH
jgi:hypothetical protein